MPFSSLVEVRKLAIYWVSANRFNWLIKSEQIHVCAWLRVVSWIHLVSFSKMMHLGEPCRIFHVNAETIRLGNVRCRSEKGCLGSPTCTITRTQFGKQKRKRKKRNIEFRCVISPLPVLYFSGKSLFVSQYTVIFCAFETSRLKQLVATSNSKMWLAFFFLEENISFNSISNYISSIIVGNFLLFYFW